MSNQMTTNHVRSTSVPAAIHPLTVCAEEQLQRLKSSAGTSTSSTSTICQRLDGLRKLYDCVDDVLKLPTGQEVISHENNVKLLEQVSDVSLNVLETCSIIKDALSQMKESVQLLESCLRRGRNGESNLSTQVDAYVSSNKKLNKVISKCFRDLKQKESNQTILIEDSDFASLIRLIKGVEDVSITVLESTLSYISHPKMRSKASGWSMISKMLKPKRVSCEGLHISEEEKTHMELLLLRNEKIDQSQMLNALKKLQAFESSIQELEEGLGVIFRLLLKNRVSLLNILSH
ncbi:hypothetical protein FXO38_35860 [Capsicum annuum]|uniref:DUF241 domain protein n=1 Tax=Capsicum annuum TaxID=4072 RepID=A0A2G2ZSR7_CAPAN|nr:uncharacterized protein LOC107868521 [Capsicum annuum]KAF3614099.1 hypothetical protein FXO38_35860 [Capsicum annuum]PHT85029.1 hypothetical protein T459_13472 [Capsicum annuum]